MDAPARNGVHAHIPDPGATSSDSEDVTIEPPTHGSHTFANRSVDGHRRRRQQDSTGGKKHLVVHQVTCTRAAAPGEDHKDHAKEAYYFDVPRLFAYDTRASALRGQKPLDNLDDYLEEHPQFLVVVIKTYRCQSYHSKTKALFELSTGNVGRRALERLRPWLYQLPGDGPPAVSNSESIQVSESLDAALANLINQNQPLLGKWDEELNLNAPYNYFYHFRKALREQYIDQLSPADRTELVELLDYIDEARRSDFDALDKLFGAGQVHLGCFNMLFATNELVVTMQDGLPRALVAENVDFYGPDVTSKPYVKLDCWTWAFDGSFRKVKEVVQVMWPVSTEELVLVSIQDLKAWPLRLDKTNIKDRLLKRGKQFWNCRNRKLVCYNAPMPTIFELQITNPKYMIDYRTYRQMHPQRFHESLATEAELKDLGIDMSAEEPPSELFCVLQAPTILGYAFHDKKWRTLSMEHIGPVPWNKEAFSRLVLKPTKKETIKALVMVHLTSLQNVDVVENKGNGLIILLHGSPGTGKTLTAESVAEIAEKPLYRVTCGDVGTEAEKVERYMESVLLIGTIWECVVLLDEADVFLEERQVTDLARNALVSVFLRILEYYEGILILTTNRVGTFDEAFKSRIQLAVHYPALDEEGRLEIWLNFINVLKEKNVDMDFEQLRRKAIILARTPLNGRQIRNCLWTAAQVAKYKKERLDYSHLEQVVDISREFEDYLTQTRGHTDEENAIAQGIRMS